MKCLRINVSWYGVSPFSGTQDKVWSVQSKQAKDDFRCSIWSLRRCQCKRRTPSLGWKKQESETATTSGVTKSALLYEKERITDELNNIQRPTKEEASQEHGEGGNIRLESRNTFTDVNAPRCQPQGTFQKDALTLKIRGQKKPRRRRKGTARDPTSQTPWPLADHGTGSLMTWVLECVDLYIVREEVQTSVKTLSWFVRIFDWKLTYFASNIQIQ